jgi:hypothetical protein
MDAAADYAEAVRLIKAPLPAYVSYTERSYGSAGSFTKDTTHKIVIRTRDGVAVSGNPDVVTVSVGKDERANPVSRPPFDPACYVARASRTAQWEGNTVEAIDVRETCPHDPDDNDFSVLYVDPKTHEPLAAAGNSDDPHVSVSLEQRYARIDGHVLPTHLKVHIVGHGLAGFLDVSAGQDYTDYRFSETMPG